MTAPSVEIAALINTAGIATTGTDMFIGTIPEGVGGFAIQLLDSGGPSPVPKYTRDYPEVQIIIRGDINGYAAAWAKGEAVKNLLLGHDPVTVGSIIYASFLMRSDLTFVGFDANKHPLFSLNFRLTVDGPNTGNRLSIE